MGSGSQMVHTTEQVGEAWFRIFIVEQQIIFGDTFTEFDLVPCRSIESLSRSLPRSTVYHVTDRDMES